jgi:hypothetical protein
MRVDPTGMVDWKLGERFSNWWHHGHFVTNAVSDKISVSKWVAYDPFLMNPLAPKIPERSNGYNKAGELIQVRSTAGIQDDSASLLVLAGGAKLIGSLSKAAVAGTAQALSERAIQSGVLDGANYAQKTFSATFSAEGSFAGKSVSDVAGELRSGSINPSEVPVQYIVRDGNKLILNTRSAQALEQAGVARSQWNAVNMTGDAASEARLSAQLRRNGLTSEGTPTVRQNGQ